ncbi:hypothetical protein H7992_13555 [Sporosarcina sp. resist]|uniref:hypothetical protein n=1 Tax=Sporosarcina sp. resist TaxID=2762563 RepID=UPI00164EB223|nr:hypothetical protein [Sporosarcina sp. resist]QNK86294.1 hypothetical protein H7992_13555 [Sporosarcina sp. resist]
MGKHENDVVKKWGERDWIWLTVFLVLAIILLIASIFAKDKGVQVNFSIVSSAVSIALALVAITIAQKQESENRRVNELTSRLLSGIDLKLLHVDEKVKNIDAKFISGITTQAIEELNSEEVGKESYSKDEVKIMLEGFSEEITMKINNDLYNKNKMNNYQYTGNGLFGKLIRDRVKEIISIFPDADIHEIRNKYVEEYGDAIPINFILKARNEIKKNGIQQELDI